MAETGNKDNYALLNPQDLETYIRVHGGHSAVADKLVQTLMPVLSRMPTNLRLAEPADLSKQDTAIIELQIKVLGRKFYVFDPAANDVQLQLMIGHAARILTVIQNSRTAFKGLELDQANLPRYLRQDFFEAALCVPDAPAAMPAPASPVPAPLFAAQPPINREDITTLMRESLGEILKEAKLEKIMAQPTETMLKLEGGWTIERYVDFETLDKAHEAMERPLTKIDREKMQGGEIVYYGVIDPLKSPRALFSAQCTRNNENSKTGYTLLKCRSAPDTLPPPEIFSHLISFVKHKEMYVYRDASEHGLWRDGNDYVPLNNIPENFTARDAIELRGFKGRVSFDNLKLISASWSDLKIIECPDFRSFGGLTQSNASIIVDDCENFSDIGALRMVGVPGGAEASLRIRNCPGLTSLEGLRFVNGSLNIRGTAVREIPESLERVKGRIYTDLGEFYFLGSARKAFARHYGPQRKLLPAPATPSAPATPPPAPRKK